MCIEIGLESTRNPRVGEIHQRVDRFIAESFEKLFQRMKDEGRIAPALDIPTLAKVFMVIADGMFWRRAVDPAFDPAAVMPAVLQLIRRSSIRCRSRARCRVQPNQRDSKQSVGSIMRKILIGAVLALCLR